MVALVVIGSEGVGDGDDASTPTALGATLIKVGEFLNWGYKSHWAKRNPEL